MPLSFSLAPVETIIFQFIGAPFPAIPCRIAFRGHGHRGFKAIAGT
jgi:hypothetical protein